MPVAEYKKQEECGDDPIDDFPNRKTIVTRFYSFAGSHNKQI